MKYLIFFVAISLFPFMGIESFAANKGIAIKTQQGQEMDLYTGSYALLIGVSEYTEGWTVLRSVPGELEKVDRFCT